MRGKLTNIKVTLISAAYKDNIYDDSGRALYNYACNSCGDNNRCPYARFRLHDSRVCFRRISYDHENGIILYCDVEDPIQRSKYLAFIIGKLYDRSHEEYPNISVNVN